MTEQEQILSRARQLALAQKLHGRTIVHAIMSGQWDGGSYVRQFIPQAEAELIRDRKEAEPE